jgi:MOSC domain-containing protein YiiM
MHNNSGGASPDNSAHGGVDTQITAVGSADSSADNIADNSAHGGADTQITAVGSADSS